MSTPPYDPYAPPRDDPFPPPAPRAPLPAGIRRHGLDVVAYRAQVAKALNARIVRGILIGAAYFVFLVRGAHFPLSSLYVAIPVWGAVLGGSYLLARARTQRAEPRILQGYELLVSPRVLRRTAYGFPVAEILAPEVRSIVEIPEGLSLVAQNPTRRLLVGRSVERFAEVRDHVRTWAPIEVRSGLRAYLRRRAHAAGEKTRDARDGALALDPTLRGELEAVRVLAMPFDPRSVRARRSLRVMLVLWLVLLALLAAIWEILSPPREPSRERTGSAQAPSLATARSRPSASALAARRRRSGR